MGRRPPGLPTGGKMRIIIALVMAIFMPCSILLSEDVTRHPDPSRSLPERWQWAVAEARPVKKGFWIGFSFDRMMPENEFIGTYYSDTDQRKSLLELLTGQKALSNRSHSDRLVLKELAILFKIDSPSRIRSVRISHLNLFVPLEGRPLFWLGRVEPEQSIPWLEKLYDFIPDEEAKKDLIYAISAQQKPALTIPFLQRALAEKSSEIRAEAAICLALQNDPGTLPTLKSLVEKDVSKEVIENAMAGISEMKLPAATQMLIDWTDTKYRREIRMTALVHLTEVASEKTVNTLRNVAYNDGDTEVQKQALYALSDMEGDQGLTEIIRIAKSHPNPEVRKQAIYLLGDSEDPRARQAIVEIVTSKN